MASCIWKNSASASLWQWGLFACWEAERLESHSGGRAMRCMRFKRSPQVYKMYTHVLIWSISDIYIYIHTYIYIYAGRKRLCLDSATYCCLKMVWGAKRDAGSAGICTQSLSRSKWWTCFNKFVKSHRLMELLENCVLSTIGETAPKEDIMHTCTYIYTY